MTGGGRQRYSSAQPDIAMSRKKTLYEILSVAPTADGAAIAAAYQSRREALEALRGTPEGASVNTDLTVLKLAWSTLSDPGQRAAYDAKLLLESQGDPLARPGGKELVLVPKEDRPLPADAQALKAEVLALRADALALRADAIAARSGIAVTGHSPFGAPPSATERLTSSASTLARRILIGLGTFMVISIIIQLVFFSSARRSDDMMRRASDKAVLQEINQTHGIQAATRAEAERMEAELRREENERRRLEQEKQKAEEDRKRSAEEEKQWVRDATERVRQSEEAARWAAQQEAQRLEAELARRQEAERQRAEAERWRIEREKQQWENVLRR
jgi:curved DNA-binding protein CbpA